MTDRPTPEATDDDGPLPLRLGVLLLWVQAALVALLAVVEIVGLVLNGAERFEVAAWVIAGPLVAAAGLFAAGRLLVNRKLAGRGLAVVLQLCAVPVVFFMLTGQSALWVKLVGAMIGVSVLACIGLVNAPASRRALLGHAS